MIKTKSLLILIFSLLFSNYYLSFSQELTITTYYPSPVGIYKELRAKRMAIGDSFYDPSHYCWEGSCTVSVDSDADLIVEGKVGIKTENPQEELHVAGDAKVEDNLNVDGDVQLGDSSSDKTKVEGNLEVAGTTVLKNDVRMDEGLVVGNPTGGNKGAGTINAEKIYVDGSEIGGGGECIAIPTACSCCYTLGNCPCDPGSATCPTGYTQVYTSSAVKTAATRRYYYYLKITTCCK